MEDLPFPKNAGVLLTGLFTLGVENEEKPGRGNRFAEGNPLSGYSCVEPVSGTYVCVGRMIPKGKDQGRCSSVDNRGRCCSLGNEVPPGEVPRYMATFDLPNPGENQKDPGSVDYGLTDFKKFPYNRHLTQSFPVLEGQGAFTVYAHLRR